MKRPEAITLFIDRSLGKHAVSGKLREAGAQVEIHDDHFPVNAPDQEWLAKVGHRGWVVLTKDKNFQHRQLEIAAVAQSKVRVFQLSAGNLRADEMAQIFVKALDRIAAMVKGNPAPFIAKITGSSKVSLVFSHTRLKRYSR